MMSQPTETFEVSAFDGLKLRGRKYFARKDSRYLPVICLPGLTRNGRDFSDIAEFLSQHPTSPMDVYCFDYRGRGLSEYDKNWQNYSPLVESGDVISVCDALAFHHAAIIGTSRGGMLAMVLAALRPGLPKKVILNDIGPEIDGIGLARIKATLERHTLPATWAQAESGLRELMGGQFTAFGDEDWKWLTEATYKDLDGKPVRDFDANVAKLLNEIDLDQPLPDLWPQFVGLKHIPVLTIRGENSDLLSASIVEKMHKVHPQMQSVIVPGQGHAPKLMSGKLGSRILKFLLEG